MSAIVDSDRPSFRRADQGDLVAIVRLLSDDPLGAARERFADPLPESYLAAFAEIDADPNNELVVASVDGDVVGVFQLTFVPSLTYQGARRATIEGVRVAASVRARGIGTAMIEWAIDRARARGCRMLQLTTDKLRPEAQRFYERHGFVASHEGMKLRLVD
jgi:GNAT superfamily N-acetyltransferase